MISQSILADVAIILAATFPTVYLIRRAKLPAIVGMLIAGVLIGPHAIGLIHDLDEVNEIAELGVILILFFVGLEFPLARLRGLGASALIGGSLQIAFTVGAVALLSMAIAPSVGTAIFYGLLVAFSSTAVIVAILKERDELLAPYGRRVLGVLLFQDLAVIPVTLMVPALAAAADGPPLALIARKVAFAVVAVVLLVAIARYVVPRLMEGFAKIGSRETFTAGVAALVIGMIIIAERAGVSAALGAFAAGIVVAESDYIHEVAATLRPLRDLLSSLFFVSIGMLLQPRFLLEHPALVAAAVSGVIVAKTLMAYPALRLAGAIPPSAIRAAFPLATVGEFSFILSRAGREMNLLTPESEQLFVVIAVITLGVSPALLLTGRLLAKRMPSSVSSLQTEVEKTSEPLARHVIVIGFGLNGANVSRVLSEVRIPFVVIEENPDRIREARDRNYHVVVADASTYEGLAAARAAAALAIVIAISDPEGTRRVAKISRRLNSEARLIVRTRYVSEVDALRAIGADEVIPEEFETSIEIVTRVLRVYRTPGNIVAAQLRLLRDETYKMLRDPSGKASDGRRLAAILSAGTSEIFLVLPDTFADGRKLEDLNLNEDQIAVPAVIRDGKPIALQLDETIAAGDTLLLAGAHDDLNRAIAKLERPRER